MSSNKQYPFNIPYREPRPRGSLAGLIGGALLGWLFTGNPLGALAGGAIGSSAANQPLPLEAAVRAYFNTKGTPVVSFYRLGPSSAKVLFSYGNRFWIVESNAPDSPGWTPEDLEDWLYGDIIQKLNTKLSIIPPSVR